MLNVVELCKSYRTTEVETRALDRVSLRVETGEFVAVMGPSGCGKSTLLNILGLLDTPDSGEYRFFGEEVSKYPEARLAGLRRNGIGFIFQSFNLIDGLNVFENVDVALLYRHVPRGERRRRVNAALERVGVAHRAHHLPRQLSGGQQQRVAIARALVGEPALILADEPTGNLDSENGTAVMNLLGELNRGGTTIIMVTHSLIHAASAKRTIQLLDGHLVSECLQAA